MNRLELGYSDLKRLLNNRFPPFEPFKSTVSMQLGSAIHYYILENDEFSEKYCISQFDDFRTKIAQDWKKANSDKIHLKAVDYERIQQIGCKFNASIDLSFFEKEPTIVRPIGEVFPEFDMENVFVRAKPDLLSHYVIADLKTVCKDILDPKELVRDILKYQYHMQLAYYALVSGNPIESYEIYFISKEKPFDIHKVTLSEEWIELGMSVVQEALSNLYRWYHLSEEERVLESNKIVEYAPLVPYWATKAANINMKEGVKIEEEKFVATGFLSEEFNEIMRDF